MIDSYFRTPYQSTIINPLLPRLMQSKLSPNFYTGLSLFFGILITPSLALGAPILGFVLLLLSGFLDTIDGSLARAKGQATPKGAVFDIFSDRAVEVSIILGLFLINPEERGLLCLLMLGSAFLCVTTFLVVGIFVQNEGEKGFHYSAGIMERSEAFFFFSLMILLPSLFIPLAWLFSCLVTLTAIIRMRQFSQFHSIPL